MKLDKLKVKKITPILVVDAIEPALPLWCGPLGFEKVAEVPHEGRAGFVLLARDGAEVMMQTRASVAADFPAAAKVDGTCVMYVEVASLDEAKAAVAGLEVVVPERVTFYGAREIFVRDGARNVVGFAEQKGE